MKKLIHARVIFLVLLAGLFASSCAQDPIFYHISMETELNSPVIEGSPQNIVITSYGAYVWTFRGSNVWSFEGRWGWRCGNLPSPGYPILGLTAVGEDLYAAIYDGGSSRIMSFNTAAPGAWQIFASVPGQVVTRLYSAGGRIFARSQPYNDIAVRNILRFPVGGGGTHEVLRSEGIGNTLFGVAERPNGNILLATSSDGIFQLANAGAPPIPVGAAPLFSVGDMNMTTVAGMIRTGNDIVVAGNTFSNGRIFIISPGDATQQGTLPGGNLVFTGGMSTWLRFNNNTWEPSLLLLGVRSLDRVPPRGFLGYRELHLNASGNVGSLPVTPFSRPGDGDISSVGNPARFRASLGNRAVEDIVQIPPTMLLTNPQSPPADNWQPPVFASTAREGLWVYNFRGTGGEGEWNADNNTITWP